MKARGGWTLLEMLWAVALLGVFIGLTGPVFKTLVNDVPSVREAVEANGAVRRMLGRLRADVEAGRFLPAEAGELRAGPRRILIDTPAGLVCYELGEDTVARRLAAPAAASEDARATVWRTPRARIDWQLRRAGGRTVGMEVRTAIERSTPAGTQPKLANSHVFFLAATGDGAKTR